MDSIGENDPSLAAHELPSGALQVDGESLSHSASVRAHEGGIFRPANLTIPNRSRILVRMNRLSTEKRAMVIGSLVEGNSIRSTVRMTGAAKNTVTKLLVDLGAACAEYQNGTLVDLPCRTLQCDEIWAFCYSKG